MKEEQKQLIENARKKILNLAEEQNKVYSEMVSKLGVADDFDRADFLWDYVFNCDDSSDKHYLEFIRKNVFKEHKSHNGGSDAAQSVEHP